MTGGTAEKAAVTMANDAVVQWLSSLCIAQFQQDAAKDGKLVELMALRHYQRANYVKDQGWATMPGDEAADPKVASECAKLLVKLE